MARGWFISALPPDPGVTPRVRFLVAIRDQDAARRAVEAWHPGFNIIIEGEAGADAITKLRVRNGTIFMLDDES
jgi:hypothetical protein